MNTKWWSWIGSIRSWVALFIVGTFCYLAIFDKIPSDKVQDVVILVVTFYFLKPRPTNGGSTNGAERPIPPIPATGSAPKPAIADDPITHSPK